MAKISRLAGSTGHVLTVFVQDTSKADGSGLAGLTNASSGLVCGYKRNTASTAATVTLDTIAALGTYGTYAAGHGGFKEVDSANLPGFYEFQPPNAALASGAKSVAFMLRGATNMAPVLVEIELTATDNQDGTKGGLSNLDAAITTRSTLSLTTAVAPTGNTANTLGDCLNAARAQGFGKWVLSGTTLTIYAPDGTTAVRTFTLDSASNPTQRS